MKRIVFAVSFGLASICLLTLIELSMPPLWPIIALCVLIPIIVITSSDNKKAMVMDAIDPQVGRKIICFSTHGCQGEINKFMWIGTIIGTRNQPSERESSRLKQYVVEVLKSDGAGESRDRFIADEYVVTTEVQNLGDNLMIVYK